MTGTEETSTEQRITKRKIDDLLAKWSNAIQRPLRRKTTPASDREGSISEDYHPDDLSNKRPRLDSTFSTSSFESNPIPNPEIEYDLSTLTPSEDHYDPTSLSLFLSRLKSFKPSTYQIFNPVLSPPECAKHGWINSSLNKLVCTVCGELLRIDLSSLPRGVEMDVKGESVAIRRYRELLKERHDESCPWRRESCSDSLYTYPLLTAPPTRVFSSLSRNYGSLLHLSNDLPELTTLYQCRILPLWIL
ncbi:C3HC zinc finger-like-domain-containing protein [Paraphysoderma sedebokerense]|nr:C3HC zinc finger-like-domain-containing protein [Paraphysoderma sedebokerense]